MCFDRLTDWLIDWHDDFTTSSTQCRATAAAESWVAAAKAGESKGQLQPQWYMSSQAATKNSIETIYCCGWQCTTTGIKGESQLSLCYDSEWQQLPRMQYKVFSQQSNCVKHYQIPILAHYIHPFLALIILYLQVFSIFNFVQNSQIIH